VPPRASNAASNPSTTARQPPLAEFERRVVRKVTTGQIEIDARLDLHGLTQSAAHRRLRSFLRTAQSDGCRIVLVITGKGRENDSEPATFGEHMEQRERGVLKRSVPIWLEDPEMRAIVVSYTNAAQPHGGSGALYIRLRRRQG
jgi:DNA-nicking Smr family endonuclease